MILAFLRHELFSVALGSDRHSRICVAFTYYLDLGSQCAQPAFPSPCVYLASTAIQDVFQGKIVGKSNA